MCGIGSTWETITALWMCTGNQTSPETISAAATMGKNIDVALPVDG